MSDDNLAIIAYVSLTLKSGELKKEFNLLFKKQISLVDEEMGWKMTLIEAKSCNNKLPLYQLFQKYH